jgi:segregation and condensation protein A
MAAAECGLPWLETRPVAIIGCRFLSAPTTNYGMHMRFRVELDIFSGPLDLLFYLVRKHELDVLDIPIARVTGQYLDLLSVLEQIDVNAVADFLELASQLIEIKSRLVLPCHDEEEEYQVEDPRDDLVRRLLEYKKYKDAAIVLEEKGRQWRHHYTRRVRALPERPLDTIQQPIQEVELWDLVSAFGRVMRQCDVAQTTEIRPDDLPIEVYMERIRIELAKKPKIPFEDLFEGEMTRMQLVGMFLALLELMRYEKVEVQQQQLFGPIWVWAGAGLPSESTLQESTPRHSRLSLVGTSTIEQADSMPNATGQSTVGSSNDGPEDDGSSADRPIGPI